MYTECSCGIYSNTVLHFLTVCIMEVVALAAPLIRPRTILQNCISYNDYVSVHTINEIHYSLTNTQDYNNQSISPTDISNNDIHIHCTLYNQYIKY